MEKDNEFFVSGSNDVPTERLEHEIAAYYHWLDRGCPIGDDLTDWFEAERNLVVNPQNY
jgi:hypothetical protein